MNLPDALIATNQYEKNTTWIELPPKILKCQYKITKKNFKMAQ